MPYLEVFILTAAKKFTAGTAMLYATARAGDVIRPIVDDNGRPHYLGTSKDLVIRMEKERGKHKYMIKSDQIDAPGIFSNMGTPEPLQKKNRSKHHDYFQTYNNLEGGSFALRMIPNPSGVKQDLIDGMYFPCQNGMSEMWGFGGKQTPHVFSDEQITPARLLENMAFGGSTDKYEAKQLKNSFRLTDEEVQSLGSQGLSRMRTNNSPGWRMEASNFGAGQWASKMRTVANFKVRIARFMASPNEEYHNRDRGYYLDYGHTGNNPQGHEKIKHPISRDSDNLSKLVENWSQLESSSSNGISHACDPLVHFPTVQEAIQHCESYGLDWVFDRNHEGNESQPVARHKLYTDNFPYRGMTKKPLSQLGAKRQRGGDWAIVAAREWDPTLVNHFDEKPDSEVFA